MKILVLSEHDVRRLLDMESCIDAMAEVLASLARGELHNPLRSVVRPPGAGTLLGLMPAYRGGAEPSYALKEIVIVPSNPARGLDTHMGAVLLHDGETGELVAVLNASPVTEIRTAAVSAVATRTLARPDARRVAILGAGAQARGHVHAMRAVLDDPEIRIWARRLEAAEQLASEVGAVVAPSVDAALFGAEVVCTTTAAAEPIVERRWLARGAHVNAVGACSRRPASWTPRPWRTRPSSPTAASPASPRPATSCSPRRRARSDRSTSAPSWARCSPACTPAGRERTS